MKKKKKIVHIIPSLVKGGGERFVVDLCNALSVLVDYEVYLISLYDNEPESTFRDEISDTVRYHSLNKRNGFDFKVIMPLYKLLAKIDADVVHTHLNAFEYALLYKLRFKKTAFFHTLHSDAFKECDISFFRKMRRISYKLGWVRPITISRESSASYKDCYQLNNDIIIENGRQPVGKSNEYANLLNRYKSSEKSDQTILVSVGRIVRIKNHELLIDAVNDLYRKELFDGKLLIVGDVQEPDVYERLKEKASDCVEFVGSKKNVVDYLLIADAFCMSSLYEGMPISLIEAFSVGCVPICTAVGGIKEMISHGVTGFLSKDLSKDAYELAILEFLQCDKVSMIRDACKREFDEKYHIKITALKYSTLYAD